MNWNEQEKRCGVGTAGYITSEPLSNCFAMWFLLSYTAK